MLTDRGLSDGRIGRRCRSDCGPELTAPSNDVTVDQRATFMFIAAGRGACAAEGHIIRVDKNGEFIVVLDKTSPDFRAFVSSLAL
jgi:hypothetical protein